MVWAYDEETGENAWKPVVRLFRNQTKEWYHVFVDGEEIVCTAEHPFYVVDKGFVPARTLKADDKLLLSNGKQVAIDKIEIENLAEFENTYNFEVADFHTYYVSESNVLVHNKCKINDLDKDPLYEVEIRDAIASDFSDNMWKTVEGMPRAANGNTISSIQDGKAIHKSFMKGKRGFVNGGGSKGGRGLFDGYDSVKKIVYKLKPRSSANIRRGIAQLRRYQRALIQQGNPATKLVLVLY